MRKRERERESFTNKLVSKIATRVTSGAEFSGKI